MALPDDPRGLSAGSPGAFFEHQIAPGEPASAEEEVHLAPPDCRSAEELSKILEPLPPFQPPPPEPANRPQFSLGDVMIVMVGVAIGLAGGTWMPADLFAALLGLATLLGLLLVHLYPPETHLAKLVWATLVLAYVMAVFAALVKPVTVTI